MAQQSAGEAKERLELRIERVDPDTECARGIYHAAGECCTLELAPVGAVCDGGVCAPNGRCLPERAVRDEDRVRGPLVWLEVLSEGDPLVWHVPDDLIRVAVALEGDLPREPPPQLADEEWESFEDRFGGRAGRPVGRVSSELENVVDQCVCNGTSVCDPVPARSESDLGRVIGCSQTSPRATPLPLWPCENAAFPGGDGNLCTDEVCCEPDPDCRYIQPRIPPFRQPAGSTAIVPFSDPRCQFPFPRRQGGPGPGGVRPLSADLSSISVADRVALHCNDRLPCTVGSCPNPGTGTCTQTPLSSLGTPARPPPLVVPGPSGRR